MEKKVLELMEEFHTDLVISDIKMPFMDGLELAKQIQENYINTKVILFSVGMILNMRVWQ